MPGMHKLESSEIYPSHNYKVL